MDLVLFMLVSLFRLQFRSRTGAEAFSPELAGALCPFAGSARAHGDARDLLELAGSAPCERRDLNLFSQTPLEILDKRDEVAVAGHEDDHIERAAHPDRIHRHADIPVGLLHAARVDLQVLHAELDPLFFKSLKKRGLACGGLALPHVAGGADERAAGEEGLDELMIVDAGPVEVLRGVVEILDVDENPDPLVLVLNAVWHCPSYFFKP